MDNDNNSIELNNTDKNLNISDVIVSKTNESIKLQLMSLYRAFGKPLLSVTPFRSNY